MMNPNHVAAVLQYAREKGLTVPYVEYEVTFKGVPHVLRTARPYTAGASGNYGPINSGPRRLSPEDYEKVRAR